MGQATDAAFTWARANLDSACNKVTQSIGSCKMGGYDSAHIQVRDPGQLTIARHVGKSLEGFDLQGLLDALPSSATYLIDKIFFTENCVPISRLTGKQFIDFFSSGTKFVLPNNLGVQDFLNDAEALLSALITDQAKDDWNSAIENQKEFIKQFTTRGIFDSLTITALFNAFESLLLIGLDILQGVIRILMKLFKFAAKGINATFHQCLTFPELSPIYGYLRNSSQLHSGEKTYRATTPSPTSSTPSILAWEAWLLPLSSRTGIKDTLDSGGPWRKSARVWRPCAPLSDVQWRFTASPVTLAKKAWSPLFSHKKNFV